MGPNTMTTTITQFLILIMITLALAAGLYWLWHKRQQKKKGQELPLPTKDKAEIARAPRVPESRFIEFEGARIHYLQAGSGPDVVLLHGIGASVFIWRFIFPLLQGRYRVTALDLPGFGQSCKEPTRNYGLDSQTQTVARALEELGIHKPFIVGSSMGGAISLWLAKLYPKRFSHIVALAPATDPSLVPLPIYAFSAAVPYFRKALNRKTMKLILSRVLARKELITDDVVDAYLKPFLEEPDTLPAFWSALSLLADKRLPSALQDVHARVLVIYGEKDMMVPRRSMNRLMKVLPNASFLLHKDGGHHIMEDEPEWLAEELIKFFSTSIQGNSK